MAIAQEYCEQYWTIPEGNTPQNSSCTVTYHPSRKLSKVDDPGMQDCWRSKDELISDILLWTPSHGWAKVGRPAITYMQQLCANTGCSLEDLPGAMDDIDGWQERVREIRAGSVTWWWWWWCMYYIYMICNIYIIILIIIMSCREHGLPGLSLSIRLYCPSHSAGPLDYILYLYRAVVDRFRPDVQHLLRPCEGVHRRTSLMSLPLLLQQCPACLVRLIGMVLEMGDEWLYCCCFVGCCFQDLFNITHSIRVQLPLSFFSIRLISVHVVHPYSSMDTTAAWKKTMFYFIG